MAHGIARGQAPRMTALVLLLLCGPPSAAAAPAGWPVLPEGSIAVLDANRLGLRVSTLGHWSSPFGDPLPALEYPRGSGLDIVYAGGFWAGARVGGELRTAIAEYGSDFVPGLAPLGSSTRDDLRHRVWRWTAADTSGRAAWASWAVPQGAPASPDGDVAVWTTFTDCGPEQALLPIHGHRLTAPLGLEVRLTGWAYDRPGALRDVAYLRWRITNRNALALDSLTLGIFLDPLGIAHSMQWVASDTSRDMLYSWRQQDDDPVYGLQGPALGVRLLQGPAAGGAALRMRSMVAYPNGSDPADESQYWNTLRGLLPWGAVMLDSSTGEPTRYWSPGDPVTGLEWVATGPPHGHAVLAVGPLTLAPGESCDMVAAVVVGQGADRFDSIRRLRASADEALEHWRSAFSAIPPREVLPLRAGPNPSRGEVRLEWTVTGEARRFEIAVFDLNGRRVRSLFDGVLATGDRSARWDGNRDDGSAAPQGLYLLRVRSGAREATHRVTLLR
ncbi:MAG: hypothetical protein IT348_13900 [Candidatus Eisenbacteria bacterium]|nr:hypothetical protein [Candidatus Eisenbacteria bacterium]